MNKNWPRWARASLLKWIVDNVQIKGGLTCFIETTEHIDKDGNYITRLEHWVEVRFNGPITTPITLSSFTLDITVNVIIVSKLDQTNTYDHDTTIGIAYAAFVNGIEAFKLGSEAEDDGSYFGCFQLETGKVNGLHVHHFGQIDTDVKLTLSTIEAHYIMHLDL